MKIKWLVYLIVMLVMVISPAVATISINDSNILFNNTGHNISFGTNQTFDNMSFPPDYLMFSFNSTEVHVNSSSDLILSNITYTSDISNMSANGTGTLNIAQQFQNNSTFYYLFINHTFPPRSYSISNTTGWATYSYDLSSVHDITITSITATITSLLVTAVTAGTAGNSITTTETSAVASWASSHLTGGLGTSVLYGMQSNILSAGETGSTFIVILIIALIGSIAVGYMYGFIGKK